MAIINKIFSIKKIDFFPPKKKKILFIGSHNVDLFDKHILSNHHSVYEFNSLNLFVLFSSIFRKYDENFLINYIVNYIKFSDPDIVATFIDNYHNFYKLKKFFYKKIFISIQNGWRGKLGDFFDEKFEHLFYKMKVDFLLTFNDTIGKKFKEKIECKNIKIGSFRSNIFTIKKFTRNNSLAFISSYKNRENEYFDNNKILFKDYFFAEKFIVNFLSNYCLKNNMQLFIIPCKNNNDEFNYYSKNKNNKFNMLLKKNRYCSYEYIDDFKFQVGTDTTLSYESLFRGNRICFFNLRKNFISKYTDDALECHNFLWPGKIEKEGQFWTHKTDETSMTRVLKFVINCTDIEWNDVINNINKDNHIFYDHGNTKLKKLIKENLN